MTLKDIIVLFTYIFDVFVYYRFEEIAMSSVSIWKRKMSADILQKLKGFYNLLLHHRSSLCDSVSGNSSGLTVILP